MQRAGGGHRAAQRNGGHGAAVLTPLSQRLLGLAAAFAAFGVQEACAPDFVAAREITQLNGRAELGAAVGRAGESVDEDE